ncbi:MAG: acyl-CoA desaturase [Myxococcales bacterium]|nr:acyl-CoA desaturase [Myxococcales bacterium]
MATDLHPDAHLPSGNVSALGERISFVVFWAIHWVCLAAIWTGISWRAGIIAIVLYFLRMFAITGGYHRYFSHRTYRTSRAFQFLLGLLGTTTVQKGPLWWASTHRKHHKYSDTPEDVHSPRHRGFWYSHVQWITTGDHVVTDMRSVRDFAHYPELVWLGKYHFVPPLVLAGLCGLAAGWSGVIVGFAWSTVIGWHATFTINSLAHVFGARRYETTDTSRNNWYLALLTMGEGWHNNHHHYMNSANQGFFWWEVDLTYYLLRGLAALGLVWDLRKPPAYMLERNLVGRPETAPEAAAAAQSPADAYADAA